MKILTVSLTLLHRPQEKTVLFLQMLRQLVSSGKKICQTEKICNSNAFLIEMCKYFSPNAFRMFSICLFQRFYLHKRYYTTKFIKYLINLSCFWRFPQFLQNHRSIISEMGWQLCLPHTFSERSKWVNRCQVLRKRPGPQHVLKCSCDYHRALWPFVEAAALCGPSVPVNLIQIQCVLCYAAFPGIGWVPCLSVTHSMPSSYLCEPAPSTWIACVLGVPHVCFHTHLHQLHVQP